MSDVVATLALSVVLGVAAAIGFYFVGELSSAQSIFLGFIVIAFLAPLLNWMLFRPLPKIKNGQLVKDE